MIPKSILLTHPFQGRPDKIAGLIDLYRLSGFCMARLDEMAFESYALAGGCPKRGQTPWNSIEVVLANYEGV